MMCLQLPAVNKPSQHPGPHWLGWLRVVPRALHSAPPPSSISVISLLIFHSYFFFFFPFLPLILFFFICCSLQLPLLSPFFFHLTLFFPLLISQASSSYLPSIAFCGCQYSRLLLCFLYFCTGRNICISHSYHFHCNSFFLPHTLL